MSNLDKLWVATRFSLKKGLVSSRLLFPCHRSLPPWSNFFRKKIVLWRFSLLPAKKSILLIWTPNYQLPGVIQNLAETRCILLLFIRLSLQQQRKWIILAFSFCWIKNSLSLKKVLKVFSTRLQIHFRDELNLLAKRKKFKKLIKDIIRKKTS